MPTATASSRRRSSSSCCRAATAHATCSSCINIRLASPPPTWRWRHRAWRTHTARPSDRSIDGRRLLHSAQSTAFAVLIDVTTHQLTSAPAMSVDLAVACARTPAPAPTTAPPLSPPHLCPARYSLLRHRRQPQLPADHPPDPPAQPRRHRRPADTADRTWTRHQRQRRIVSCAECFV